MPKMLAEKFTNIAAEGVKNIYNSPKAKELTLEQVRVIQLYLGEAAREAARTAYRDCSAVAKLAQDQALSARDEKPPTSQQYAALDGAVGAFGGMALTYLKFEGTFCDGEEYRDEILPSDVESILGPSSASAQEHKLKDPRKK